MTSQAQHTPMLMEERPCPACGSADHSRVYAESTLGSARLDSYAFASRKIPEYLHHRLIECPVCELLYASPVPRRDDLHEAYEEAAYDSGEEARYAAQTYRQVLDKALRDLADRDGALDIGAGDGAFLEQLLDAGFTNVKGIEPSAAPIRAARSDIRPLIVQDIFKPERFAPASLSLITLFQTLEHVQDPLATARDVLHLLKPGGIFFIISHDRKALPNRLMGLKSPIFDLEHMQLFCDRAIRKLLERAGFTNISVTPIANRYPVHYWFKLFPAPRRIKEWMLPRLRNTGLGKMLIGLRAGNFAVIGRKPTA